MNGNAAFELVHSQQAAVSGRPLPIYGRGGLFIQHVIEMCSSIRAAPFTFLTSFFTVAAALFLFALALLVISNIERALSKSQEGITFSVYLSEDAEPGEIAALKEDLKKTPGIKSFTFKSREDALDDLKNMIGKDAALLEGLEGENPLPASLEVSFESGYVKPGVFRQLKEKYEGWSGVAGIEYGDSLLSGLERFLGQVRLWGFVCILAFAVITAFLISNTARLALYAHREEVEIMKLVGASDSFISAPYLLEGVIQGAGGAALALLALRGLSSGFAGLIRAKQFFQIFADNFEFLSPWLAVLVVCAGALAGAGGAYCAVRRYCRDNG